MATPSGASKTAALVRAAREGDVRAYGELIDLHFRSVFIIALARLREREMAEDLAQEVFLRAQLHLHQLTDTDRFEGWVCRMTRNLAIDWLRRGQRASRLLPMVPIEEVPAEIPDIAGKGAREIVAAKEQSQSVHEAIMDLPAEQREVVLLHFTEDLTQQEIAERLGINQATVSRQIRRALKALRGSLEPVLREAAPTFLPAPSAIAKSLALAAVVGAMSASAKATLAASATVGQWTSAVETAQAGAVGAVGVIGFLKSLPTLIAGGTKVMATGKGLAATIATAAAITAGGFYVSTQGQPSTGPIASGQQRAAVPTEPGAHVMGDDGQWIAMLETDPDAVRQLWTRASEGENIEDLFTEMGLPVIPRVQEMIVVAPDLEWTWDETIQGDGYRLSNMEPEELEISAEDLGSGAGPWRVTLWPQPKGDALIMAWVNLNEGPERMWMARLEGESVALEIPEREGIVALTRQGEQIPLTEFTYEEWGRELGRLGPNMSLRDLLMSLDVAVIPRDADLIINRPGAEITDLRNGLGDSGSYDIKQGDFDTRRTHPVGEIWREIPGVEGVYRVHFTAPVTDDLLGIEWEARDGSEVRMWMAQLGEVAAASPNEAFRVIAINPDGAEIVWPFFGAERGAQEQARVESGEITMDQMLNEMNIPFISRQAHLQFHNLPGDIRQVEILETFLSQPELAQTVSMDYQPIPGEPNAWTGTFTRQLRGDFLSIPTVNAAGEPGAFAVRLRPLAAALLTSDARALACQANLRRIREAIYAAAHDSSRPMYQPLTMEELVGRPYFLERPVCPAGGVYGCSAGPGILLLDEPPTCSLGGDHVYIPLPPTPPNGVRDPGETEAAVRARLRRDAP